MWSNWMGPWAGVILLIATAACGDGAPRETVEASSSAPVEEAEAPSESQAPEVAIRPADGVEMIWIAPGEFLMGSDASPFPAERPERVVSLDGYWIDRLEVSNALYSLCVEEEACGASGSSASPDLRGESQPALVTWSDAAAYCGWVGARLPTEAEWEKSARGTDGRLWPWGDEFEDGRANLGGEEDGFKHTAPVGSFASGASPYGVLDMAGNAAEWVADWHDPSHYRDAARSNPTGPASGRQRVYRSSIANGGGGPEKSRTVARYGGTPDWEYGFRCAKGEES